MIINIYITSTHCNGQGLLLISQQNLMFSASRCVHISFVVYQFGMAIRDECEAMVHSIQGILDVYLDWVVLQVDVLNVFNFILLKAIF